jgi:hypothetical protein
VTLCVLTHLQIESLIDAFVEKVNSQPREAEALDRVPPRVREGAPDVRSASALRERRSTVNADLATGRKQHGTVWSVPAAAILFPTVPA